MNYLKKLVALVMVLTLMFGVTAIGAEARATTKTPHYDDFMVIGDSYATGYRLPLKNGKYVRQTHGRRFSGSFPDLIAKGVGAKTYYNYAREGISSNEVRLWLDPDYQVPQFYAWASDRTIKNNMEGYKALAKQQKQIRIDAKKADLIVICIGANDLAYNAFLRQPLMVKGVAARTGNQVVQFALEGLQDTIAPLLADRQYQEAFTTVLDTMIRLNALEEFIAVMAESMLMAVPNFFQNWNAIMDELHAINPKAKIVVMGLFNGLDGMRLTPYSLVNLTKPLDLVFEAMNGVILDYNANHNYYTFVRTLGGVETPDWIPLTELLADPDNMHTNLNYCSHPTPAGHKWLAQQALNALR